MKLQVFISLNQSDHKIAVALDDAFKALYGDQVKVSFSTKQEVNGGIDPGKNWLDWIVQQVKECHVALILLTPASMDSDWQIWEAGAVSGAGFAASDGIDTKSMLSSRVRPLLYRIDKDNIPAPIRDSKAQAKRGDDVEDMRQLFTDIMHNYGWGSDSSARILGNFSRLQEVLDRYYKVVDAVLSASKYNPPVRSAESTFGGILNNLTAPALMEKLTRLFLLVQQNTYVLNSLSESMAKLQGVAAGAESGAVDPRLERFLSDLGMVVAMHGQRLVVLRPDTLKIGRTFASPERADAIARKISFRVIDELSSAADGDGSLPERGTIVIGIVEEEVVVAYSPNDF